MTELFIDTPLSKAIFELFEGLEDSLRAKYDELPSGVVKAYIFGGCAVHIYTNARGSNDLDTEFEASRQLDLDSVLLDVDTVYFEDPAFGPSSLYLDRSFNTGLASVSPSYKDTAVGLVTGEHKLHIFLVSALEVAVSKLSRLAEDDLKDIIAMYDAKRFDLEAFIATSSEAVAYSPTPDSLKSNVDYAIRQLREHESQKS